MTQEIFDSIEVDDYVIIDKARKGPVLIKGFISKDWSQCPIGMEWIFVATDYENDFPLQPIDFEDMDAVFSTHCNKTDQISQTKGLWLDVNSNIKSIIKAIVNDSKVISEMTRVLDKEIKSNKS